ncbi:CD99 molecule isoform 2-T2 [Polymixia lowei]
MKFCLRIALLLFLLTGTNAQELDLLDAFGDDPTPAAPKTPKAPEKPKADGDGFDLLDALGPDTEPKKPQKPAPGDTGDLDILDGLDFGPTKAPPPKPVDPKKPAGGDSDPKPDKPAVNPPKSGEGGGTFDDSDLFGVGEGDYKPDPAKPGSGGRAQDPGYDANGGDNAPTQAAGSGQIAGIASAIGMALLGAASSYFAYQKKKLCFKIQGGVDPESGKDHRGTQSEPQVLSNLLKIS